VDWLGAAIVLLGLGAVLLAISRGQTWGWSSAPTLGALIAGLVVMTLFVAREATYPYPLVEPKLFRIGAFASGLVAALSVGVVNSSFNLVLPFYWQGPRGLSAQEAGVLMLALPLPSALVGVVSGRLSDKVPPRWLSSAGMVCILLGTLLVGTISSHASVADMVWRVGVVGVGMGLFSAPNQNQVMSAVAPGDRGVASGLQNIFRFSSGITGFAVAGAIFSTVMASRLDFLTTGQQVGTPAHFASARGDPAALAGLTEAFLSSIRAVLIVMAGVLAAGLAAATALALRERAPRR
jgi:MFS family permease